MAESKTFLGVSSTGWAGISIGARLGAGISDMISGFGQARLFRLQGDASLMSAELNAQVIRGMAKQTAAQQKADYLSSGVNIGGTSAITIAQTIAWGEAEAKQTELRGQIAKTMSDIEATRAKYRGISSLVNSTFGALSSYGAAATGGG